MRDSLRPRLTAIAPSAAEAVRYAGGWLFDQVMAGWDVTVVTDDDGDPRPLDILGVRARNLDAVCAAPMLGPCLRAIALRTDLYHDDERVRRLVGELMQAYADHYPYLYVYVQEDMTRLAKDDASSTTLRRLARRFNSAVEGMLAAGIESGEFKADLDPRLATYGVLGALNWSHRWFKPGGSLAPDDVAAVFVEMFLYGLTTASARCSSDDQSRPGPDGGRDHAHKA